MAKVSYLSFTGFATYLNCPEAYYYRYVKKVQEVDANQVNFVKGNALHHLLEWYFVNGVDDPNVMFEQAPLFWSNELSSIERNPRQTLVWHQGGAEKQRLVYMGWAFELAKLLKKHDISPARVRPEFKADCYVTIGHHRIKMGGRIDLLLQGKNGGHVILDLKSSVNKDIVKTDQVVWYALLTDLFLGKELDQPVGHGGFLLPGFPEGQKLQIFKVTQDDKARLLHRISDVLDKIKADQFKPIDGKGCWFCPFKTVCSIHGGALEHKTGIVSLGG